MDRNPWDVQCLEEYLVYFFSCPECQELKQSEEEFLEHAMENHPNSKHSLLKFLVKDPSKPVEFEDLKRKVQNMFSDESKNETKQLLQSVISSKLALSILFSMSKLCRNK